jgi:hypothetical protein
MLSYTLDLTPLVRLEYLRLVNIAPADIIVRSGCMVSVDLHSEDTVELPLCASTTSAIRTAKRTLGLTV